MFFQDKGFTNEPRRCKPCMASRHSGNRATVQTQVKCATCGCDAIVPFLPRRNEPVLCRECFRNQKVVSISQARLRNAS